MLSRERGQTCARALRAPSAPSHRLRLQSRSAVAVGLALGVAALCSASRAAPAGKRGNDVFRAIEQQEAQINTVRFRCEHRSRIDLYPIARLRRLLPSDKAFQVALAVQKRLSKLPESRRVLEWKTAHTLERAKVYGKVTALGLPPAAGGAGRRLPSRIPRARRAGADARRAQGALPSPGETPYNPMKLQMPVGDPASLLRRPPVFLQQALSHGRIGLFLRSGIGQPRWEVPADGAHRLAVVVFDHPSVPRGVRPPYLGARWRFWLDRRYGYRPVRHQVVDPRGRVLEEDTITYRRCRKAGWFFDRLRRRFFYLGPNGDLPGKGTETSQVLELVFNRPIYPEIQGSGLGPGRGGPSR